VDFVIKLPAKQEGEPDVLLPVDSKFPVEDYERLLQAYEAADPAQEEDQTKLLQGKVKQFARDIRDKYIAPPKTTSFAVMFVPTEGLYGEVVKDDALFKELLDNYHVIVAGPTNMAALLNSLQLGFSTLAIQKSTLQVQKVLQKVKLDFEKFSGNIEQIQKSVDAAHTHLERLASRVNTVNRDLAKVQELPETEASPEESA
jgi:DNA recombination protein RmuC